MPVKKHRRAPGRAASQLRIIGGRWRGRKLAFTPVDGLRPTPDRVRETLFNWLAADVPGARCLDLFAGSGALGLEALSREAASVTLVDASRAVAAQLRQHLDTLGATAAEVVHQPAETWLQSAPSRRYDLVFLDPPFGQGLAQLCIDRLEAAGRLRDDARIYVETGIDEPPPRTPPHWQLHRDKHAGQVCYRLYHRGRPQDAAADETATAPASFNN